MTFKPNPLFHKSVIGSLVALVVSSVSAPALAQGGQSEVAELRAQIEALSARLAQLEDSVESNAETAASEQMVVVEMGRGGLDVESADGEYNINIGGRLHLDYVQHEHVTGLASLPNNGSYLRRSRLEIDGTLAGNWEFAAELDFAENRTKMKDVKIGYAGDNWTLFGGHQKQPYSLALEMSSNDIPWVERSIDNALVAELTDRAVGIRYDTWGDNWFAAVGLFGDELGNDVQGDEGWAYMGRFIYTPVRNDDAVVHLGLRAAHREFGDPLELRVKNKTAEFSGFGFLDTGTLDMAEEINMYGPEFAMSYGPFMVMGEYSKASLSRAGMPDADFTGWYVGGALTLTGESRTSAYRQNNGEFKGLRPGSAFDPSEGNWGAFELTARYSTLDLNDGVVTGGESDVLNAGLNWIINPNMRMLFDWTHVLDTDESNAVRTLVPGMDIFTIRTQYNY